MTARERKINGLKFLISQGKTFTYEQTKLIVSDLTQTEFDEITKKF